MPLGISSNISLNSLYLACLFKTIYHVWALHKLKHIIGLNKYCVFLKHFIFPAVLV